MQNRKSTLIVIIVLLVIFLPLAIFTTTMHMKDKNQVIENPNHEFFYNGKLYFYHNDELLGTYTCESDDYCDYAISRNNFSYELAEHKGETNEKIPLINNRYAFLMDASITQINDAEIILYDLETKKELGKYTDVKNYGIGIDHNNYLVKNKNGLWGVLQFYDGVNLKIPFTYDYIALADQIEVTTNLIMSDTFSVQKDGIWYLIDINNNKLTQDFNSAIFTYNKEYVITKQDNLMNLFTYNGNPVLSGTYKYLNFCDKYLAVVDSSDVFYLLDLATKKEVTNRHMIKDTADLKFEVTNNRITIFSGEELIENVAIH